MVSSEMHTPWKEGGYNCNTPVIYKVKCCIDNIVQLSLSADCRYHLFLYPSIHLSQYGIITSLFLLSLSLLLGASLLLHCLILGLGKV